MANPETMMKYDDHWLETTQVDIQLSCAIQKLENVLALEEEVFLRPTVGRKIAEIKKEAFNLGNLTRHSRELFVGFEEYICVGGEGNNPLDKFEEEVLNLAYRVEDATSSFLCRREMNKKRQQGLTKKIMLFNNLSDQYDDMLKEIMKAKIAFIFSTNFSSLAIDDANSLFSDADMLPRKATDYSLKFGRSNFGMTCKEYHLWGYLSILGEVGSGKTTFARDIYRAVTNDPKQGFEISAWVSVRPEYKITDIYTDIVQQQEDPNFAVPNEIVRSLGSKGLTERVTKWLESCRFIIVLDDVHYIWSKIKSHFKYLFPIKTTECSTVIITTCEAQASEITRVIKVLGPLSEKDGWELFKNTLKKANMINQMDKQAEDDAFNKIKTELPKGIICKMDSYLPIEIFTLARLYMTYKDDNQVSSSSLSSLIDWDLNFQLLPPRIRQCYLYMGIFPEKFEIPIRRLFRLWIAERLVVPDLQSSETPEGLARSYLTELETKQLISVKRKNGHPKTCCMPFDKHRFFSRKAMALGIFHVHKWPENSSRKFLVRLAEHADFNHYTPSIDDYKLRSYISLNRKRHTPARHLGGFLHNLVAKNGFGLLRVLDLENVYKPLLPAETLEKLFLLTYLGLRRTFLDSLPDSVGSQLKNDSLRMLGKLSRLETLRFYGQSYSDDQIIFDKDEFSNLVVLKLWKLEELKILEMKEGALLKLQELDIRSCHNLKSTKGLEQVGGLQNITLADMHDGFVATVKSEVNKDRLVVTVLEQVGGLKTIALINMPGDFVETVISEVNKVRAAVEVLEQVGGLQTITLINMPDDFVETVKPEVKSKVNKHCVVVKVQNLKSSPTSSDQSNNNMRGHGRGRNSGGRIVCQLCDEPGHTVHGCLYRFDKNFSGNKNQDNSFAHYSSPDVEWPLDGGAANHVTADQSNLQQKSKYGGMDKLIIGNGQGYGEGTSTWHT